MAALISCPYCNAPVPPPRPFPPNRRIICPRCGEQFPVRLPEGEGVEAMTPETPEPADAFREAPAPDPHARQEKALRSIRRTLIVGISLGVLGLLVGLGWTFLRPRSRPEAPPTSPEPPRHLAPAEFTGLGYLPDGTDAVVALNLTDLAEQRKGEGTADVRSALRRLGVPESAFGWFERTTGLRLEEIDQIVVGLRFDQRVLPPQVTLVIHARKPFDAETLLARMKARTFDKGGKTLHSVRLEGQPLPAVLWLPSDRVLIAGIAGEDFDAVPNEPRKGIAHLSEPLRDLIGKLPHDAPVWGVAHSDRWAEIAKPYLLLAKTKDDSALVGTLEELRSLAFGVSVGPKPTLSAWVRVNTEDTAKRWRSWLAGRLAGTEPAAQVGGGEGWVYVRAQANSLEDLGALVRKAGK